MHSYTRSLTASNFDFALFVILISASKCQINSGLLLQNT